MPGSLAKIVGRHSLGGGLQGSMSLGRLGQIVTVIMPGVPSGPGAPAQPRHGGEHANPSEHARCLTNLLVLHDQAPLPEQRIPVVLAATDQLEGFGAGVGHVHADVQKIFKEPETTERRRGNFALPEKITAQRQRRQQFAQSSSQNRNGVAEGAEKQVTAFMDHQIYVVEEKKLGGISQRIDEKEKIAYQPGNSGGSRDGLPFVEEVFEKFHGQSVARLV